MPSCMASSFSHGEAFISSKPERTTTFTSSPPRRREVRQQSIAVLPPPSTITRLPILVDMAERDGRQPVDADMDVGRGFLAAGDLELAAARRARADEDGVVALGEQRLQAVDRSPKREIDAEIEDVAALLVDHGFGQAEVRDLRADHAARLAGRWSKTVHVIAERRKVARDGERGRARRRRSAMRLPFFCAAGFGRRSRMSSL